MKYFSVLFLVSFFCFESFGQFNYERSYTPNTRGQVVVDMEPTGGGYYILSSILDSTKHDYLYGVNLIKMEIKGGITSSRDYVFSDSLKVLSAGGLEVLDNGSIIFAADVDTLGYNKLMLNLNSNSGQIEWSNKYGIQSRDSILNGVAHPIEVFQTFDMNIQHNTTVSDTLLFSLYTSCTDTFGVQKWSKAYDYIDSMDMEHTEQWGSMTMGLDNNTVGVGQLLADSNSVFITEFDFIGTPNWARKYTFDDNLASNLRVAGVEMMSDTTYIISGTVSDSLDNDTNHGFVMRVDTLGQLIWAKKIGLNGSGDTYITSSTARSDTSIMIATKGFELAEMGLVVRLAEISTNGNIVWQREYKNASDVTEGVYEGHLALQEADNGYAYAITGTNELTDNNKVPYLIKTDENGMTRCHNETTAIIVSDLSVTADTMGWNFNTNFTGQEEIMVSISSYEDYGIPALELEDISFCPNVPIDTIFDATIESATSYLWGSDADGETTPILRVTEEGDYTVEVVIDSFYCYSLCDTAKISRQGLPMANISFNNQWCQSRNFLLIAGNTESTSTTESVIWSTGETVAAITVETIGTYSVTITDNCDETSSANFTIDENQIIPPDNIAITLDANFECFTPTAVLTAVLQDNPSNEMPGFTNIIWSSGQTDMRVIRVTAAGEYSVTLTDDCGYERTANITVNNGDLSSIAMPDIITNGDDYCTTQKYTATLANSANYASWIWTIDGLTVGGNQETIEIDNPGNYVVRVTDVCGESMDMTFTVLASLAPDPQVISISSDISFSCFTPAARLTVTADNGSPLTNIIWTPGNISAQSILVTEVAEYVVTAVDDCGYPVTASFILNELSPVLAAPALSTEGFGEFCDAGSYRVVLNNADAYGSIEWSFGDPEPETGGDIEVTAPGTYTVTVTDACGSVQMMSIDVTESEFPACPCLEYPNIFTPDITSLTDTLDLNSTFGPYNKCDESLISDYELVIYNRWGNEVFTTTDLDRRWNGNHNDDPAPTEVYLFYARYTTSNEVFEIKGDVTLVR